MHVYGFKMIVFGVNLNENIENIFDVDNFFPLIIASH